MAEDAKQPDTFYIVADTEWLIDKVCDELGAHYGTHELEISAEQLAALQAGKVLVATVGSLGTAEYAVVVRLGHKE